MAHDSLLESEMVTRLNFRTFLYNFYKTDHEPLHDLCNSQLELS
jgi:hypothetical protein